MTFYLINDFQSVVCRSKIDVTFSNPVNFIDCWYKINFIWVLFYQRTYSALRVLYNNAFWVLMGLPCYCSASSMLAEIDGFHTSILRPRRSRTERQSLGRPVISGSMNWWRPRKPRGWKVHKSGWCGDTSFGVVQCGEAFQSVTTSTGPEKIREVRLCLFASLQ